VSRTIFLTAFALLAFALNSILCRLALRGDEADAAGFTAVRLLSGVVMLVLLHLIVTRKGTGLRRGSWPAAIYLFGYAICFSLAYLSLTVATGALILFGTVQLTIVLVSIARGERPTLLELLGLAVALGGLVYLVLPGLAAPPLNGSLLMALAGISWAFYTLRGKGSADPLGDTAGNFVRTLPFAAIAVGIYYLNLHMTARGALLAVLSGSVASAIGYLAWYAALKHHSATRIAVLQLAVPVIVAVAGVMFMAEAFTTRLLFAASLILGGIGLTIAGRAR
jgi:drug/metabolite transporter (DMT)-like permease